MVAIESQSGKIYTRLGNAIIVTVRTKKYLSKAEGFSLLEVLIGGLILVFILTAATLYSRTSIKSNLLGQGLVDESAVLKKFVEQVRSMDFNTLPRNREVLDSAGEYKIHWIAYDQASSAPYRQPNGLVLLCVKVEYRQAGIDHKLATVTLLGPK
jgi:hypothetical protein